MEFKSGLMEPNMKESGLRIRLMERENSGMQMVTFTRENGKMTRLTVLGSTSMLMEQDMKATGRMIFRMELVLKLGMMDRNTKVNTKKV